MLNYWMISDRSLDGPAQLFGSDQADLTYWFSDAGPLDNQASWTRTNATDFEAALRQAVAAFPPIIDPAHQQDQQHIAFFVHGYNNTWQDEAKRYQSICDALFSGPDSLGLCIWFDWPSKGSALGYLPDRGEATSCAADFCDVLDSFYEWLLEMEKSSAADPTNPNAVCRAKLSVIAHSMGNFLLQKAMYQLWTRKNRPLLVSLINQLLMVAADVDNDLFKSGETVRDTDGDGIANLTYRVTAFYSGLDAVLGASAGLKHFGKRRLGRSGLDTTCTEPDNVWDTDCTTLLPGGIQFPDTGKVHSIYFENSKILDLMRQVLRGLDRGILAARGIAAP